MQQKLFKGEVYSSKILTQETRKISNKQSNLIPKGTRKRKTNKDPTQPKGRKEGRKEERRKERKRDSPSRGTTWT